MITFFFFNDNSLTQFSVLLKFSAMSVHRFCNQGEKKTRLFSDWVLCAGHCPRLWEYLSERNRHTFTLGY